MEQGSIYDDHREELKSSVEMSDVAKGMRIEELAAELIWYSRRNPNCFDALGRADAKAE